MQPPLTKEEAYLAGRWASQRDYYSRQSRRNKQWHQSLLSFSSISALIVPVLLNTPEVSKWIPTILSLFVSMALALDNVYHFGDNWRTFRQALESLKQERIFFDAGVEPYSDPQTAFPLFVQRCEAFMSGERRMYFELKKQTIASSAVTHPFDVFFCYQYEDKLEVKEIGERLKARGISPWLDERQLRPAMLRQHPNIKSVAVFIGKEGIGPWQDQEIRALLREFVKRNSAIILVLLPGCKNVPELPVFLKDVACVDLREEGPDPLAWLIGEITRERARP